MSGPATNQYEHADGVGGWGGWCTCPDGQQYNVGDKNDGCAHGTASLACFGGTPGECHKEVDPNRQGMQVTCAAVEEDSPASPPQPNLTNVYEKAEGVGGWGGWCTCPDGQQYNVGDQYDGCANGPASLACFGGAPGQCNKVNDPARNGMQVTCGVAVEAATTTTTTTTTTLEVIQENVHESAEGIGGWGGWCTCPDGKQYNVGDKNDGCAQGPASLACFGGTPGQCNKEYVQERFGMKVTCAGVPVATS